MKVCYVAVDVAIPHYRGASTHVYEVAKNLAKLGHEVHVISRQISFGQSKYEVLNGFHVHRIYRGIIAPLPFSSYQRLERERERSASFMGKLYEVYLFNIYSLYAGLRASQIIKRYKIEVIIERETSFGAGAIASMITKKPMILELIGPRYSKRSFKKSRRIIAYTRSMIRDLTFPEKLVFVTAAADTEHFKPNFIEGKLIRERYGLQDSLVVGYVGTFAKWHGMEELIDASVNVLEHFPNVRFLMVGPYFGYVKDLAQKRGISDAYVFTGPVPYLELSNYINAADILVAPYNPAKSKLRRKYGIGSPLKVFEYMACGKPVITTYLEPITQVIKDGETGILIPPDDSKALSEAIIYLIERPKLAEKIGRKAREEVEKFYSWMAFAVRLENILKKVFENT